MTFRRSDIVGYLVPILAIITLTILLTMTLLRLSEIQQDMRNNVNANMLWVVSQTHIESMFLADALYQHALDPQAQVDIGLHYKLFMSRLNLLSQGPQARFLNSIGIAPALNNHITAATDMAHQLKTTTPGDPALLHQFQTILKPLSALLSTASSKAMVTQWEEAGARLDTYRNAVLTILFLMIGILVSSVFISARLMLALKKVRESERAKRHAVELEKELEAERKVSELYRSFGAMVSHQFRTPLAIIDASMQRLERGGHLMAPAEIARRASKVRATTKRLTHLIESTLIADRISQNIEVKIQKYDLCALASEAIDHQLAITPTRRISLDADTDQLEQAWCDPVLTEHVLFNFISNAAKYSPDSSCIQIRIFQENHWIVCSVHNEGPGIPEHELPRIFDQYFRAETSSDVAGTGMGLYVAQQLALMQYGQVSARSTSGEETVFELRLHSAMQALSELESAA